MIWYCIFIQDKEAAITGECGVHHVGRRDLGMEANGVRGVCFQYPIFVLLGPFIGETQVLR